jgi:hypothetical protein
LEIDQNNIHTGPGFTMPGLRVLPFSTLGAGFSPSYTDDSNGCRARRAQGDSATPIWRKTGSLDHGNSS